ncbi:hypothetical protein [Metabacillus fastidiosus]|uniref:IDEAL domain-containing protein n=1 Tax=Metabacillus fastidiosus TaxID=1458 RepID=A0ABU6NZR4_9BACI|nr:hypothetical protein [Metabacillus fastidiosus]MEC2074751.1 hypothetical protein [Metabacillus fastidiosus]MED4401724.1 hypothetical protein [Metabacillus fastidiosus]MED4452716.1 hypothetical protein [Metabacillus fastidiosus]MED4463363.1 hypothetical protein [Metabacillus fastidiosus]MED4532705.1 hypothetical protein [Metabacillus fastidiosus]
MKQIVKRNLPRGSSSRIGVLRLELDYELATLYDAMQRNDDEEKKKCKQKLERLRNEWMRLHS